MQWLLKPNSIELDDACMGYICIDRAEPCTDKNPCIVKYCGIRYCYKNH